METDNYVTASLFISLEWNYVRGNIKYDDAWMKPAKQNETQK